MTPASEACDRFNRGVAAICDSHPEQHHTCSQCGEAWCAYWTESNRCPKCEGVPVGYTFDLTEYETRVLAIRTHGVKPCACCGEAAWACPYAKLPGQCDMGSCVNVATRYAVWRRANGVISERRPCCDKHAAIVIGTSEFEPLTTKGS